jgi:tetratricopeptide (TPR) repeat protein
LNVYLRNSLGRASALALGLLAPALVVLPAAPAAAQEVVQDEGAAYRAWHEASQANDNVKASAAAQEYIAKYPTGQYADFMKKWLGTAQMGALDAAIKAKNTADMLKIGNEILAADPENLNVVYAMAQAIRAEMLGRPPVLTNAAAGAELANKGIALVESGKTLVGVQNFDKNATLGWMTQMLALNARQAGNGEEAIKLFEKSTAYAPNDKSIAAYNLFAMLALHQTGYAEAAKAYNALPEADRGAAEPPPAVKEAREKLNAEADHVIDVAARFVAFGRANGLPPATVDKVNQTLEAIYKTRFPEDASLAGLQKLLQEKSASAAAAPSGD